MAAHCGHEKVLEVLVPLAPRDDVDAAVWLAAAAGRAAALQLLLRAGGSAAAVRDGVSAADAAARNGHAACVALLRGPATGAAEEKGVRP